MHIGGCVGNAGHRSHEMPETRFRAEDIGPSPLDDHLFRVARDQPVPRIPYERELEVVAVRSDVLGFVNAGERPVLADLARVDMDLVVVRHDESLEACAGALRIDEVDDPVPVRSGDVVLRRRLLVFVGCPQRLWQEFEGAVWLEFAL